MRIIHEFFTCPFCGVTLEVYDENRADGVKDCFDCGEIIDLDFVETWEEEF